MSSPPFPIPLDPPVLLAPMSGITDLPFRRIVARFGAGLLVSEMIASGELVTKRRSSRARARIAAGLPTAVQLAGRDPTAMAEAARIAEAEGAPLIDINMGCPAKKVVGGLSGSALMRDLDLAQRLIEAVVRAVRIPVTLKTRLGWDIDCLNAPELARRAEASGVRMITIHGRTRAQFYTGRANWRAIREVGSSVRIPLIANGDVLDASDARTALAQSGAQGVMIGRGAQGRPWLLAQIAAALYGGPAPVVPTGGALVDLVGLHYESMLSFYGRDHGLRIARKHLGWYVDAAGGPADLRARLMRAPEPAQVLALLADALCAREAAA
ncbi:tRNA dihydrouridine synthase DusB [Pararhodobacter sp. SW119]|uniref:tRNA dihydrouridine synthase DusB n=1 Tax=Pararhodobacter sp. SW119 TaxID=2780075 RepID=UPI001ADFA34D|nr:tRNA dihydrouridine synthase DusB [Pararhodobacter sp. SW119]